MINRYFLPVISVFTAASIASLATAADSVLLKNGNTLSGKLTDSDTSGILTLANPDAKQPIKIRETSVERIFFDANISMNSTLTQSIQLINGDRFPCIITELNDKIISFKSDSIGDHTLTRDKISKIKYNTKANKTLYTGPGEDLSTWTSTSEDWKLKNGTLSTTQRSEIAKKIPDLTENYILEFKTSWDDAPPHFRVCFSSNNTKADKKSDHFVVDLNAHGIVVTRNKNGDSSNLTQIVGTGKMYEDSKLHIAIHVDRKSQKLAIYVNGKFTKTVKDEKVSPPGSYIVIKNRQRPGILTKVTDIKVSSWSGKVQDDIKSKADALTRHDLMTDLSGNVMTGQIISMNETEGKTGLNFKAPFAKSVSNIPGSAIDLLEFKTIEGVPMLSKPIYQLKLVSGGIISYSSSQMTNGKLTVEHPYLGKVSLPTTCLASVVIIPEPPVEEKDATDK